MRNVVMQNKALSFWWGVAGTFWGLFIAAGSLIISGAGDGWVSPLQVGILAIFTTPLSTIAWAKRGAGGKQLATFSLTIAAVADIFLFFATLSEGTQYFYNALPYSIIWLVLWSSWQLLALSVVFHASSNTNA